MGTRLHFTILTQLVLFSPSVVTPQLSLFSSDKIELATSKIFYEKKHWLNGIHVQNVVQCAKFQICRRVSFLLQRNTWYDFIESPHFRLPHLCTNNASWLSTLLLSQAHLSHFFSILFVFCQQVVTGCDFFKNFQSDFRVLAIQSFLAS